MRKEVTIDNVNSQVQVYSVLTDYVMLLKVKLSLSVVSTSVLGYFIAAKGNFSIIELIFLFFGGFLVTGAANTFNQVLEKDYDKYMQRTQNRPLATGRLKMSDAVLFGGILCVVGISFLALFNPLTAVLGMLSFILYSFVYTPLKRHGPISVAVGAIPGALPVLIGCTAVEGTFSYLALLLFLVQFSWQFPHFWSICFLGHEDYNKAGFKLVPMKGDKIDIAIANNAMTHTFFIFPMIFGLFYFGYASFVATSIGLVLTIIYLVFGALFHKKFDRPSALKLMFFSFFYMPGLLLSILLF